MPLTILTVAYPLAPMGMDAVGGAEQIAALLDAAIVRAGHRSLVIAREGSACQGELLATPSPLEPLDARAVSAAHAVYREALRRALSRERVDVVHLHGLDFDRYFPAAGPPLLVTLHLPPSLYDPAVFQRARPDVHLCCVSEDQARRCPPSVAPLAVIPNGVPLGLDQGQGQAQARGAPERGRFALALGRVCPEKGFHLAIDAAARAQIPLILAGEVFAYIIRLSFSVSRNSRPVSCD